ncbi:putative nucleic acid-binding protein [Ewingella americana]
MIAQLALFDTNILIDYLNGVEKGQKNSREIQL